MYNDVVIVQGSCVCVSIAASNVKPSFILYMYTPGELTATDWKTLYSMVRGREIPQQPITRKNTGEGGVGGGNSQAVADYISSCTHNTRQAACM